MLIIAHRGASCLAPENTLPAFRSAVKFGATMVELDVHQTKDGHVVVIHDERLERTTNGNGFVGNFSLSLLRKLDAGAWFAGRFAGVRIPTLSEVLSCLPRRIGINIEVKNNIVDYPDFEQHVLAVLRRFHSLHRVIISSFNWASLEKLHRLEPTLKLGLLFDCFRPDLWPTARLLNVFSLHPAVHLVDKQFIWQAHCWGYRVFPWVVNDPQIMIELKAAQVDGIITDCPQVIGAN